MLGRAACFTSTSKHAKALHQTDKLKYKRKHVACIEGPKHEQGGDAEADDSKEDDKGKDEPHKIGYRTFPNGNAAHKYYRMLLKELTPNQDLNEVCYQCSFPELPCCGSWYDVMAAGFGTPWGSTQVPHPMLDDEPHTTLTPCCLCSMSTTWCWSC